MLWAKNYLVVRVSVLWFVVLRVVVVTVVVVLGNWGSIMSWSSMVSILGGHHGHSVSIVGNRGRCVMGNWGWGVVGHGSWSVVSFVRCNIKNYVYY